MGTTVLTVNSVRMNLRPLSLGLSPLYSYVDTGFELSAQQPCPNSLPESGSVRLLLAFILRLLILLSVTGTSTGIGRAVAEVALEKGESVVATARQPNTLDDLAQRYPKQRLLILPLDVTQQDQIVDAFLQAKRRFGRVDVVFNNAAFGHIGELEATEEAKARALFDTNFWGAMKITKEAVKFFRETNPPGVGGRLLQVSSWGGLVGLPGSSFYGASKFGVSSPDNWNQFFQVF